MQRIITVEGIGDVAVSKRRNSRTMRLSVHPEKGLLLSIPFCVSFADAERYVLESREWIAKTLQRQKQKGERHLFTPQSHFNCRSTTLMFATTDSRSKILSAKINDYVVTVTYNPQLVDFKLDKVQTFIKKAIITSMQMEAEKLLFPRIDEISKRTGLTFRKVSIGNALTRWGSCSSNKDIILSCRLLMLPDHLVDFIILHELCHIAQMNHGPKFHELLYKLSDGKAPQYEKELKGYIGRILPENNAQQP